MEIIMITIDLCSYFEQHQESIVTGILSGVLLGIFSWAIHLITNTPPIISISGKICHYSSSDNYYRIKILNKSWSNLKIISANFIVSYTPNGDKHKAKNDIIIATKKEDPLLFGLFENRKKKSLRTFDTFVIDAQKCIEEETIKQKTSSHIQEIYQKGILTIDDFFEEDADTILSAVFYVQNYRTGVTRNFCQIYSLDDIVPGKFKSGRTLEIEQFIDDPKASDVM